MITNYSPIIGPWSMLKTWLDELLQVLAAAAIFKTSILKQHRRTFVRNKGHAVSPGLRLWTLFHILSHDNVIKKWRYKESTIMLQFVISTDLSTVPPWKAPSAGLLSKQAEARRTERAMWSLSSTDMHVEPLGTWLTTQVLNFIRMRKP